MKSKKRKKRPRLAPALRAPKEPKIKFVPVTHQVVDGSAIAIEATRWMNEQFRQPLVWPTSVEPPIDLDYSKAIYTFNVSTMTQTIVRPNAPAGHWTIHQRGPEEKFGRGPTFPVYLAEITERRGERHIRRVSGRFIAQDILNPEQPFGDAKTADDMPHRQFLRNEGTNLYEWGCFWSTNFEPTDKELALANSRLTKTCIDLVRVAQLHALAGAKNQIERTHKFAAATLGIKFEWL